MWGSHLSVQRGPSNSLVSELSCPASQPNITFAGGREYNYTVEDVSKFTADLTNVITNEESVGKFVNTQLQQKVLQTA